MTAQNLKNVGILKAFKENLERMFVLGCFAVGSTLGVAGSYKMISENKLSMLTEKLDMPNKITNVIDKLDQRTALELTSVGTNLLWLGLFYSSTRRKKSNQDNKIS